MLPLGCLNICTAAGVLDDTHSVVAHRQELRQGRFQTADMLRVSSEYTDYTKIG